MINVTIILLKQLFIQYHLSLMIMNWWIWGSYLAKLRLEQSPHSSPPTCSHLHLYACDVCIEGKESRQGQRVIIDTDHHLRDDGWLCSLWITSLAISCSSHTRTRIIKVEVAHKATQVVLCVLLIQVCAGVICKDGRLDCLQLIWCEWGIWLPALALPGFHLQLFAETNGATIRGKTQRPFSALSTKSEHQAVSTFQQQKHLCVEAAGLTHAAVTG